MLGMATIETRMKINADYFQLPTFHIANQLVLSFAKLTGQIKQSRVYSRSHLKTEEPFHIWRGVIFISIFFDRVEKPKWKLWIMLHWCSPTVATFVWVKPPPTVPYDFWALITSFSFFCPANVVSVVACQKGELAQPVLVVVIVEESPVVVLVLATKLIGLL